MTQEEFNSLVADITNQELKLQQNKTADYGARNDPFHSINGMASNFDVSVPKIIGILLHKHISSIYKAIKTNDLLPECAAEPLEQRIMDARAYLMFLLCFIRYEKDLKSKDI